MSSRILVEGDSDKLFIEALLKHIHKNTEVDSPVCSTDKCELMNGKDDLKNKLKQIKRSIRKNGITKIGIIIDANSVGVIQREEEIQEKILQVFGENPMIEFTKHIINIDGYGELETLLKVIKSQDSTYADCLDAYQDCLPQEKKYSDKEYDKTWVYNYQKKDCNTKKISQIYDLDSDHLIELKNFLNNL